MRTRVRVDVAGVYVKTLGEQGEQSCLELGRNRLDRGQFPELEFGSSVGN